MTAPLQKAKSPLISDLSRQLFWVAATVIVVSGVLLSIALAYLRSDAIATGEQLTESYARVIEEQTELTFQTVDQRLQLIVGGLDQLRHRARSTSNRPRRCFRSKFASLPSCAPS